MTKTTRLIPSESLLGTRQGLELVPPQHPNPNFSVTVNGYKTFHANPGIIEDLTMS